MRSSENFSLDKIETLVRGSENVQNFLRSQLVSSYEEFVEVLYDDLDLVISKLESNPQYYADDGEDKITNAMANMLTMTYYDASHGSTAGGSVDLTVKGKNPLWTWIGEAKIFSSITDLKEGFLQLTTRYRTGSPNNSQGGILAFTKRPLAADLMRDWQNTVRDMSLPDFSERICERRSGLAFYTTHKHEASGIPFRIRHNAVSLYFHPKDKSGRAAAKYKEKK
ncbi:hypothetical protein [Herbaspirillum lusitanum]|uniref:hypothetical protein n=1 Tax=Herbaspirillum lusitanum TaxID=213312 RepID=UPI000373B0DA|nr:hypothetical protein [Herbaspirillum lusitanum]